MRLIRFSNLKATRWKNGGGATTEIVAFPAGAAFDSFEWRISVADIAAEGPFSRFDGVDRVLTLASGALELTVDGALVRLDAERPSLAFAGEAAVYARLTAGPVRDVNVMTRRGVWRASVAKRPAAGETQVVVALGAGEIEVGGRRVTLAPFDALVAEPDERIIASRALFVCLERLTRTN